jgi:tRNA (guanine-N7-)-methyltransferase
MRLRNIAGSREVIAESKYTVKDPEQKKGLWKKEIFGNDNEIHIEIGMGKGRFIMDMAALHPDINYVGIEKYSSVLLRAIQKQEELQLPNVIFIRMDAETK